MRSGLDCSDHELTHPNNSGRRAAKHSRGLSNRHLGFFFASLARTGEKLGMGDECEYEVEQIYEKQYDGD